MARKLFAIALVASLLSAAAPLASPSPARAAIDLRVCGTVGAYVAPTGILPGAITINGLPLLIVAGTSVPAGVGVGANVCIAVELNGLGQIIDIDVVANTTATVRVCGVVTALARATASAAGSLTAGGRTFVLAAGSTLPASVAVGANLCLTLTLNGFAEVRNTSVEANVRTTLEVCGYVSAYTAASATTNGSITIAGVTRAISPGTTVAASVAAGVYAKLRLEIDAFARVADVAVLAVGASLGSACGGAPTPTPRPTPSVTPTAEPSSDPSADPSGTAGPSDTPSPGESEKPGPTGTSGPTGSTDPSGSPDLSGSPDPSGTPGPSGPSSPGTSPEPSDPGGHIPGDPCVAGATASADALVVGGRLGTSGPTEPFIPDPASIGRAGGVILTVGLPLLLILLALVGVAVARQVRLERAEVSE